MNNPEVTMHDIGIGNRFEVQEKAVQAVGIANEIVRAMTWRLLHSSHCDPP